MPRLSVEDDHDKPKGTAAPVNRWTLLAVPLAFLAWAIIDAIID